MLSASEQQELAQLEGDVGHLVPAKGLSPSEHSEMAQLEKEVGHLAPAQAAKPLSENEQMDANIQSLKDRGTATNNALFDTLTMGHLPQIKAKFGQITSGEGYANDENYIKRRDQAIAEQNQLADKYPIDNLMGKITGFVAPMLLTGGGSAAEALPEIAGQVAKQGFMKAAAKGAAVGATMGAAQNPGDVQGQVDPLQLSARAGNVVPGAVLGAGIGGLANQIPQAASMLQGSAEKNALKAAGATLKDFRKVYSNDTMNETGRFILDHDLVKAGDTYDSVADKASQLRDTTGQELGKGYEAAQKIIPKLNPQAQASVDQAGFNPVRDKQAILSQAKKDLGYAAGRKGALSALGDYIDELAEEHGNQTLNPALTNNIKSDLDGSAIKWARNPGTKEPDTETAFKTLRGILRDKVSNQIQAVGEAIGNPQAAENLAALNKKYGMAKNVAEIAQDRSARDAANAAFGLKEYAGAEIGAKIGSKIPIPGAETLGMIIGGLGGKAGRKFGLSTLASAEDSAAQALKSMPASSAAAQANPALYKTLADVSPAVQPVMMASTDQSKGNDMKMSDMNTPAPTKGPDKWASDGHANLLQHAAGDKEASDMLNSMKSDLMKDAKAKDLLIKASDLKPGSKAMDQIMTKIKNRSSTKERE